MSRSHQKGVALFFVLGTIMIVVILANIVLSIILSQSRLSHHQVSRIRAYYAAMAGVNLAYEKLRVGDWVASQDTIKYYCINGPITGGAACSAGVIQDDDIPYHVQISIGPAESNTIPPSERKGYFPISAMADYSSQ